MKKLIFVLALSMGTMTAFAQDEVTEQAAETSVESTEAIADVVAAQDDFSEIAADELPEAVTAAVSKNYPTASIDKAYINESNQYKLEVSLQDGTAGTLYADDNGNWIEM
ncbi:hypothetical protein [Aurantibacter crassamenti]|uniref:hypothetical protein n=1 Tax=Aurantibacter crassamenti TaxID=1837375 RepID=UPI001EEEAF3D|nr:hypothetical protein [Aurantibacter crassamenti]